MKRKLIISLIVLFFLIVNFAFASTVTVVSEDGTQYSFDMLTSQTEKKVFGRALTTEDNEQDVIIIKKEDISISDNIDSEVRKFKFKYYMSRTGDVIKTIVLLPLSIPAAVIAAPVYIWGIGTSARSTDTPQNIIVEDFDVSTNK